MYVSHMCVVCVELKAIRVSEYQTAKDRWSRLTVEQCNDEGVEKGRKRRKRNRKQWKKQKRK